MNHQILFWVKKSWVRLSAFYFPNQGRLLLIVIAYLFLSVGSQLLKEWLGFSLSLNATLFMTLVSSLLILRYSLSLLIQAAVISMIFAGLNLATGNFKLAEATAVFAYAFLIFGVLGLVLKELRSGSPVNDE